MNGFDIAAAIVICLFLIKGIIRGFVKEIASIFGLIISFALASLFYSSGAVFFDPFIDTASYRDVLGFVLVFLAVYIIILVIGLLLDKIVKTTMAKPLNITLGALVGLLKGVFLAALLLLVVSSFVAPDEPLLRDSRSRSLLRHAADNMVKLTPENLRKQFEAKKKKLLAPTALNTDKRTIPARTTSNRETL
jgi:membrane protein required for colicin V production